MDGNSSVVGPRTSRLWPQKRGDIDYVEKMRWNFERLFWAGLIPAWQKSARSGLKGRKGALMKWISSSLMGVGWCIFITAQFVTDSVTKMILLAIARALPRAFIA